VRSVRAPVTVFVGPRHRLRDALDKTRAGQSTIWADCLAAARLGLNHLVEQPRSAAGLCAGNAIALSDPSALLPLLGLIGDDPVLSHHLTVGQVVTVLDAEERPRARMETGLAVAAADTVLVFGGGQGAEDLEAAARLLNPAAAVRTIPTGTTSGAPGGGSTIGSTWSLLDVTRAAGQLLAGATWPMLATWTSCLLHAHGDRIVRLRLEPESGPGGDVINAVRGVGFRTSPSDTRVRRSGNAVVVTDGGLPAEQVLRSLHRTCAKTSTVWKQSG
jgi:hypothetical protein